MTLFEGRLYTDPEGRRASAAVAPLRIWSSTGTDGGENEAPLSEKLPLVAS